MGVLVIWFIVKLAIAPLQLPASLMSLLDQLVGVSCGALLAAPGHRMILLDESPPKRTRFDLHVKRGRGEQLLVIDDQQTVAAARLPLASALQKPEHISGFSNRLASVLRSTEMRKSANRLQSVYACVEVVRDLIPLCSPRSRVKTAKFSIGTKMVPWRH